jgi:prefoldin subunit 5
MQAINAQVTDTQLASQVQILKQRSENLATQIRKYNKHKAKLDHLRATLLVQNPASFQADMADLVEEFNVINATYKSITSDAKNLNQSLQSIGLPDFLQGPA